VKEAVKERRLECLDGVRGLLAVYVMLAHMAPLAWVPAWLAWLPGLFSHGGAAVDVFFVLSGLVILRSLDAFSHQARPFLIARAARIFPVFFPVFVFAVALQPLDPGFGAMPWIGPNSPARDIFASGWPATAWTDILAHLAMAHGLFPDAILPHAWVSFLGAAWSLSTEWQFYLLALLLAPRVAKKFRLAWIFLALGAAGLAWAVWAPDGWTFSRAFLPNKAQYFALGMASAVVVARGRAALPGYLAVLAATLLLSAAQGGMTGGPGKLAAPLVWTLFLLTELGGLPPLAAILRSPVLLALGAISYPLYLVNEPVQKLLGAGLAALAGGDAILFTVLWIPGAIALPVAAAWWLHARVEKPALRWGRALASRPAPRLARA
jgi:peptidoglycan/LPS O-acetylase OafA/YrhL